MSNAPTNQRAGSADSPGNVLHVRPHAGRSPCADDMATRLDATGLSIEVCHDVYRGLALACADPAAGSGKPLRAMVLCMDLLGAAELEFFTVVARARPQLPVYIYGETAVGSRLARAVESGVVSEVTDDLFNQLGDVDRGPRPVETRTQEIEIDPQAVESSSPAIDTALDDRLNLVAATPRAPGVSKEVEKPVDAPVDADDPSSEDEDKPVQVPWLNRPDRPVRGRPVDRTPSRKAPEPDVVKKGNAPLRGAHEPLLTNEELQALLGDDLADAHGSGSASPFDDGDRP